MSLVSFENYRKIAKDKIFNNTVISGRYEFQEVDERGIISDVVKKLDIQPTDCLLDIGCGPGTILIPLSYMVEKVCGIDNDIVVKNIKAKCRSRKDASTICGNFIEPDFNITDKYSKILIYSVIQYLSSENELFEFISKALKLLSPGGRMLIANIPNSDKKYRYENSPTGLNQMKNWKKKVDNTMIPKIPIDSNLIDINDDCYLKILKFVRSQGFESYLLPECENIPFGNTRDDILIISHK